MTTPEPHAPTEPPFVDTPTPMTPFAAKKKYALARAGNRPCYCHQHPNWNSVVAVAREPPSPEMNLRMLCDVSLLRLGVQLARACRYHLLSQATGGPALEVNRLLTLSHTPGPLPTRLRLGPRTRSFGWRSQLSGSTGNVKLRRSLATRAKKTCSQLRPLHRLEPAA
jgi:hypothetical protein